MIQHIYYVIYILSNIGFRWLISQGRIDEALKIIQKFERVNNKKIPEEIKKEFKVVGFFIYLNIG